MQQIGTFLNGRHLRSARAMAGLTRAALAEATGLHENSIKYWETDQRPEMPAGHAVDRIATALAANGVEVEVGPIGSPHADLAAIVRAR